MESRLLEDLGLHLEDSYFLGAQVSGQTIRLRVLFALTSDHPRYCPPQVGEQHCYREGEILLDPVAITEWVPGRPLLVTDPDGSLDMGGIELAGDDGCYRVTTEWFAVSCRAASITVTLD